MASNRPASQRHHETTFVIGRAAFERIGAVEGIAPTEASQVRAADFDRRNLSAAERRREIVMAHRPKR